jgi:hypothetical protein
VFAVARAASSLLTWCAVSGSSRIDPSGPRIWARGQGDPTAWEDRLLNTLIPLLLAEQGDLVLHAAALATNAGAVVVCGPSGRGKSTLAAVLAAQGLPVLAEDAVTVTLEADRILLWPGPAGVRLDPVTAQTLGKEAHALVRGKQMHFPAEPAPSAEAVPLAAIVALDPRGGSKAEVKAVTGPDALAAIFYNVLRLEIETWQPVFSLAAEVIRRVPCYTARLPDDLSRVSRIAPWLVADVTGAAAGVQAA